MFGIANTVFALGDCFLEVVSPTQSDTAAGRYMERHGGDAGYMLIFDLEDLEPARDANPRDGHPHGLAAGPARHLRAPTCIRRTCTGRSSRSTAPALTEAGAGGAGVDREDGNGAPGRLTGVTVAVADPAATAARWGAVLGVPVDETGRPDPVPGRLAGRVRAGAGARPGRAHRDRRRASRRAFRTAPRRSSRRRGAARRRLVSDPAGAGAGAPADSAASIERAAGVRPAGCARTWRPERERPAGSRTCCSTSSPRPRWRETSSRLHRRAQAAMDVQMQRAGAGAAAERDRVRAAGAEGRRRPRADLHAHGGAALRGASDARHGGAGGERPGAGAVSLQTGMGVVGARVERGADGTC